MGRKEAGITLVELSIVISVLSVVLAVFVPTYLREFHASKVSEASIQLAKLHRSSAAYFGSLYTGTAKGKSLSRCLPPNAGPTPARVSSEARVVNFAHSKAKGSKSWKALGFLPETPLRYRYSFLTEKPGCNLKHKGPPLLRLRAEGDLNGDGKLSRFERTSTANKKGELISVGILQVHDRIE